MTVLKEFNRFGGIHWETSSIANALAYQGVIAPHTGRPFSEAMLFGLSGGICVMYFVFEYEGYDTHAYIGVRNTYDPVENIYARLGVVPELKESTSQEKAKADLVAALDRGKPALVWANVGGLRYNGLNGMDTTWPVVVFGYDEETGAKISDRASVPLSAESTELAAARAVQKSLRNRLVTLNTTGVSQDLTVSVEGAIRACVTLFLDKPPRGPKGNVGLAGLEKWADLLVNEKDKKGWAQLFNSFPKLYNALVFAFQFTELAGTGGQAARPMYADFLEEAAVILGKPALNEIALKFRESGKLWGELAEAFLPDSNPLLGETKQLMRQRASLFREEGMESLPQRLEIGQRLERIKAEVAETGEREIRENLREKVLKIAATEKELFLILQEALG